MTRKIDPADRLALPRLSAAEATALTRKLLAAFEAERARKKAPKLPKLVLKTAKKLEESVAALEAALESRVGFAEAPKEGQAADLVMDRAVHALHGFLESWATIPDTRSAAAGRRSGRSEDRSAAAGSGSGRSRDRSPPLASRSGDR